ncbi:MAG: DUF5682 family protein, partial [Chloroflexi bacterium]|nr:DUF5682 family protein [Chloroflexota bacterium]
MDSVNSPSIRPARPRDVVSDQLSSFPDDPAETGILDLDARVVFFPVRHHSPAAARALQEVARAMKPAAILIEGPADFNPLLSEMSLPHTLPIAIYSYVRLAEGPRRGAFYPFCVYSPEWQALSLAREMDAEARFVDLPWAEMAAGEEAANRYSDAELRGSDYVGALCRRLGVDDLDALWDTLFESDPALTAADYLKRCHHFCYHLRRSDGQVSEVDHRREAYMAGQVQEWLAQQSGRALVITGGFHSFALFARIHGLPFEDGEEATAADAPAPTEKGIALTPYSYARLDSLTGYNAGMPNPGFYDQVWQDRQADRTPQPLTYRSLLAKAVKELRRRGQTA